MQVFATKWFVRFARKEGVSDERLCEAVARAERGSIDANLGGNLIKQRVARAGGGRSGDYRTVIAYRAAQRSVFLYGFAKTERDNINARELNDLRTLAQVLLNLSDAEIGNALGTNEMKDLLCHDKEHDKEDE
jgi:hypothetical protein